MTGKPKEIETLKNVLREAGLRATSARAEVLWVLMNASNPLSHAEVCEILAGQGFDRATLYRNLIDLVEVGIARRTDIEHLWRFELVQQSGGRRGPEIHPHFVCHQCGEVRCLPDGAVQLNQVRGLPAAVIAGEVEVHVRGVCNTCAN